MKESSCMHLVQMTGSACEAACMYADDSGR